MDSKFPPIYKFIKEDDKPRKIKKINQYLLVNKLGAGYFSKVYLAVDQDQKINTTDSHRRNNSYFAAKAIHMHESFHNSKTFEREIKILRIVNHPNIIKLQTVLYAPSTDMGYMMMELADCGTLQQAILNKTVFSERTIASIFLQISLALSYLHSKGIVHRDVKPSNILLFSDGTAKLSDFGITHFEDSAEEVCGTPSYQAPDLFEGIHSDVVDFLSQDIIENNNDFDKKTIDLKKSDSEDEISKSDYSVGDSIIIQNKQIQTSNINEKGNSLMNDIDDNNINGSIININNKSNELLIGSNKDNNKNNITNTKSNESINVSKKDENNSMNINLKDVKKFNKFTSAIDDSIINEYKIDPKKSDVWSLGISMYETAFGILPYDGQNVYEIINKINNSPLVIPQFKERQYSPLFIDLIKKMLKKKALERLSIDEVINHPFFVRFQSTIQEKQNTKNNSDSNIVLIKNRRIMKKLSFNIKQIQPPNYNDSEIVKIDAIVCPENYHFIEKKKKSIYSFYRYTFIDDS